jgi:hypothetical protein
MGKFTNKENLRSNKDNKEIINDRNTSTLPQTKYNAKPPLENAAIVFLARNNEVYGVLQSMQNIEDRFNHEYHYPYVFLNDVPFSDEFKEYVQGLALSKSLFNA